MEKQKKWQLGIIIAVMVLTLYNILPTIFYYSKPLKEPIDAARANTIAEQIVSRVNNLEQETVSWLQAFNKMLGLTAQQIEISSDNPQQAIITFSSEKEANIFRRFLPRAGALIPFVPAQLDLYPGTQQEGGNTVLVQRQIATHINPGQVDTLFHFGKKYDDNGKIAPLYRSIVDNRAASLAIGLGGTSKTAATLGAIADNPGDQRLDDSLLTLAKDVVDAQNAFSNDTTILKRWFSSFSQSDRKDAKELPQTFIARATTLKSQLDTEAAQIEREHAALRDEEVTISSEKQQELDLLNNKRNLLDQAMAIVKKQMSAFQSGQMPLTEKQIDEALATQAGNANNDGQETLSLEGRNPFVEAIVIDWNHDKIRFKLFADVQRIRSTAATTESEAFLKDQLNQFLINTIARAANESDENIKPESDSFAVNINTLTGTESILAFDLGQLAKLRADNISSQIFASWAPKHTDLVRDVYPVRSYSDFKAEAPEDQSLGLVIYAPAVYGETPPQGFHNGSIYVIARGLETIAQKYQDNTTGPDVGQLQKDFQSLSTLLQQNGFIGYPGASYGIDTAFTKDYIFELDDYYSNLLKATREDFQVKGNKRHAVLDFTDVEQRILTRNKIDDQIQEDLLKWQEEYAQAQVDSDVTNHFLVPPPTESPFWSNIKLTAVKYFRGDDRKILRWGLDLSGGKTVRIGLRDQNGRPVTNPEDIKQAVNELYTRVNKMGVSERTIRIENNNIILDFPGSQGFSAAELVKASAMYFHIVNEKFTPNNPALREAVNEFLQGVWNEAVVTNRKDVRSINEIAWNHLGGESGTGNEMHPRSETAKVLYNNGLRLANPREATKSNAFNDTISSIAVLRGNDFAEWDNQTNPLMIVFHNFALEGSSLTNIRTGYDSSRGNLLSFQVRSNYEGSQTGDPRNDFYNWTSQFAKDKIKGTPKEKFSRGEGWRMAVVLNDQIISKPMLSAALRDGGEISGRFSQREVDTLAADLKAGSLSFTPYILSEQNVSPDLGKEERTKGVIASVIGLLAVVVAMVAYYRFAGIVASCAVLFNLLIMWGVLQNLGAALTLPGIAGILLTIGMAVDANVLVFERIREEFKVSGRIASAIHAGYQKAFSAIVDSNVTTIIAALILLQFDSGPIKGFAVTLIIGILSSMFTALFMTRYFFAGWVQNPKNTKLTMSELIGETHFDFLGKARIAFSISMIIMIAGGYLFFAQRNTMFGMDFTGGYSLNLDVKEKVEGDQSYRRQVQEALVDAGASSTDVDVRELSRPTQLRIQLGIGLEENGQPFYGMDDITSDNTVTYSYQNNPRLVWVVKALESKGIELPDSQLENLDKNWTVMSGQFSDAMRNNAAMALTLALMSILVYITLRFEFKYAVGAVIGLAHDVLITLGILAFFHKMGFPVQINLEVIGAIMTIIGYSLNDTIIIFDRIREDLRLMRKMKFYDVINHALNVTLSRTLMTSGTTLLVLLAMVLLGGKAIFGFSLVMTIGVVIGTLSSLFIASPVMLFFHNKEHAENGQMAHKSV